MNKTQMTNAWHRSILGLPAAVLTLFVLIWVAGCQETPLPGETFRKKASAWPLFEFEKTAGINEDGSRWEKEKGSAVCSLSTWAREKTYDKDGMLMYRKEQSGFFPLTSEEIEETRDFRRHKGAVLIFPYESYRKKEVLLEQDQ